MSLIIFAALLLYPVIIMILLYHRKKYRRLGILALFYLISISFFISAAVEYYTTYICTIVYLLPAGILIATNFVSIVIHLSLSIKNK